MTRTVTALMTAALIALAAPVSALSFQVDFPTLTYPPHPNVPTTEQSCVELTTLTGLTCAPVSN